MVKSYQRHFLSENNTDPYNLFRKSQEDPNQQIHSIRAGYLKKSYKGSYDNMSPKMNLKLYLPQINNDKLGIESRTASYNRGIHK